MALARKTPPPSQPSPALHRLLAESALWRAALGACGHPVALIDARAPSRPLAYVNPAFEAFFGWRAADAVGAPLAALLFRGDEPRVHRLLAGGDSRWRCPVWGADGAQRHVELCLAGLRHADGELTHWVASFADRGEIEELRTGIEALRALAALP